MLEQHTHKHCKDVPSMFPGLESAPNREGFRKALASFTSKPVLPAKPAMGFCSVTCKPELIISTVNLDSPSASTWCGCSGLLLKVPALNISKLAIAKPSLLLYVRPFSILLYFHEVPAPASRRTDTRKRSRIRRVRSEGSTSLGQLPKSSPILSLPPTLKCCQRP